MGNVSEMTMADASAEREIVIERVVNAPRELVWEVWTKPEHLKEWWGPTGFSLTTKKLEFKVGGEWTFVMHGPDGRDYENYVVFTEVVKPERISHRHGGSTEGSEAAEFLATVTFEAVGPKKTRVRMRSVFATKAAKDHVVKEFGAVEGGKQTIGRMAEYVEGMAGVAERSGEKFVMRRVLRAPRELVWKVWTEREHLAAWFGPKGTEITKSSLDLREGGVFHYCMEGKGFPVMWGKWVFKKIVVGERLEAVSSFSDEKGGKTRAPFFDNKWPMEIMMVVTFEEHAGVGRGTVVTLEWWPLEATVEERGMFGSAFDSMRGGWTGTFERLERYLGRM